MYAESMSVEKKNLSRLDILDSEETEFDELKASLTDSAESEIESHLAPKPVGVRSAPCSPDRNLGWHQGVKTRISSWESLISANVKPVKLSLEMTEPVHKALVPLRTARGGHKAWITQSLNKMKSYDSDKSLTPTVFARLESLISDQIDKVKSCQEEILQVFEAHSIGESDSTRMTDQTETQELIFSAITELAKYEAKVKASGGYGTCAGCCRCHQGLSGRAAAA